MSVGGFLGGLVPPVVAELKGDIRDFKSKMGEARSEMSKTVADGESKLSRYSQVAGKAMLAVGTVILGVGIALEHLGSKYEQSEKQAETAFGNAGKSIDDYRGAIDAAIAKNERFGHTASDTNEALAKLTTATQDPAKALSILNDAEDLAAVKHISLASAAGLLARAYGGNMRVFREFGINIKDTGDVQKNVTEATKKNTTAQTELADATQHLRDVEQLMKESEQETLSDRIAMRDATERLAQAQEQAARRTRDARERLADAEESADRRIGDAQERLAREQEDAQRSMADAQSAYFAAKTPEERMAAEQRIAEVQIDSKRRIEDAGKNLADAERESQRDIRDAQQTSADSAKDNARELRDAEQSLSDARARLNERQKTSLRQEIELRDARTRVARATQAARVAHDDLAVAQDAARSSSTKFDHALDLLSKRIHGQAEARATTFGGKLDGLKAKLEDIAARVGVKYGPAIMALGGGMQAVGGITSIFGGRLGGLIGSGGSAAIGADGALTGAAGAGILGTAGAFAVAIGGGVVLGVTLHKLIEDHFPAFDRALEGLGGKIADIFNMGDQLDQRTKDYEKTGTLQSASGTRTLHDTGGGHGYITDNATGKTVYSFDKGGMVPGAIGEPRLAIVHGGERVSTPAQQRAQGGDVYNFYITSNSRREAQRAAEGVRQVLLRDKRRNVGAGLS